LLQKRDPDTLTFHFGNKTISPSPQYERYITIYTAANFLQLPIEYF
jgi:hypothetical protein